MVIGILLIVASLVLFYLFWRSTKSSNQSTANNKVTKDVLKANEQELQQIPKLNLGRIMIYFGTQTGTSSKMAEYLAEEATEKGFQPIIIDLQNISY